MFATFPGMSSLVPMPVPSMNANSLSDLFASVYGFSVGIAGLAYLGLGLGFLAATLFGARISDQIYHRVRARFLLRPLTHCR